MFAKLMGLNLEAAQIIPVEVVGEMRLQMIARELADRIKSKASLDWTQRETIRADMRRTIRRLLTKYGYPPDAQESATQLVIRQAELMAEGIVLP